jgi:multicomponent Na+:H+ antiporter subunit G
MAGVLLSAVGGALLVLGLLLATIGLYGLLRKPDIFHQLHAAGLVTGPATILVLAAAVGTRRADIVTSAVLVILFVLVTSPLSGHAIAQAALRRTKAADRAEPPTVHQRSAGQRDA